MEREFWCGLDWFDAQANCAQRCPSGSDDLCLYGLRCISGVSTCKKELGYSNYPGLVPTATPTTSKPSRSPTPGPVGEGGTTPAAGGDDGAAAESTPPLIGPYREDMVRIILYGVQNLDEAALERWRIMTEKYIESFFNNEKEEEVDQIRREVFDVSVTIENPVLDLAPSHEFNPMVVGELDRGSRNLQEEKNSVMITYSQEFTYRSNLNVLNDDPRLISQRPLESAEYRAEYVNYLRSLDFMTYGDLEYASKFLYSEFPTPAPTTKEPTRSPVVPGTPTLPPQTNPPMMKQTPYPTSNISCNLCLPGQYGVNNEVIWNGSKTTCVDIYNYYLENFKEGSEGCRDGIDQLRSVCCRGEGEPLNSPTPATPKPVPQPVSTPAPIQPVSTPAPINKLEIEVDENGLPDAESLSATYYCGVNWNTVDCASAAACPSGDSSVCAEGEECIAFTNCGGAWEFVSDPNIEGGGPDPDEVKGTFFCGSSMQFLEMNCEGATPCPNGPKDCGVESEGCFAFTGCNERIDPGKFVGFLSPPDETATDETALAVNDKNYFCAETWTALDNSCVDGVPIGATPCPSGNIIECPNGHGCFAYACNNGVPSPNLAPSPAGRPSFSDYSVEDVELVKSTFFCGRSVEEIDGDCENAIACPTGDECPEGFGCFAFSQCGDVDIDYLVSTFGRTDSPTRAPSDPVEQVCDQERKMSVNVGYWQSWSI